MPRESPTRIPLIPEEKVGYEMIYLLLSEKLLSIAQEKHLDSDYLKMTPT